VQALIRTGEFDVRIVTRKNKTKSPSPDDSAEVVTADYSSPSSLSQAFAGCDVVVNAIGDRVSDEHVVVLTAAIAAGVTRYIPSQWGSTPRTDAVLAIPFMKKKVDILDLVQKAAEEDNITFTSFGGGPWVEYVMEYVRHLDVSA
jgi:hypothetical protein